MIYKVHGGNMSKKNIILFVTIICLLNVQQAYSWSWPSFGFRSKVVGLVSTMWGSFAHRFLWIRKSTLEESEKRFQAKVTNCVGALQTTLQDRIDVLGRERGQAIDELTDEIRATNQRVTGAAELVGVVKKTADELQEQATELSDQVTEFGTLFAQVTTRDKEAAAEVSALQQRVDAVVAGQEIQQERFQKILVGLRSLIQRFERFEQKSSNAFPLWKGQSMGGVVAALANGSATRALPSFALPLLTNQTHQGE